ncbi:MAG: hypothetical protein HUU55_22820 [Myxococcales bacterium]|nr:hypothetical protein [Myxococcales bacterium]
MTAELLDTETLQRDLKELLEQRWLPVFHRSCSFDVTIRHDKGVLHCIFVLNNPEQDFRLTLEGQMDLQRSRLSAQDTFDRLIDTLDTCIGKYADNPTKSPITPRWTVVKQSRKVVLSIRGELSRPRLDAEAERILS